MKVLIISDNSEDIAFVESFMKTKGYDVIVYQWLIKAMDNLEEIKPDIVIVNSKEYPRRWKTLASFLQSGLGGDNVRLYLYEPESLSLDDKEKAKALGIEDFIPALDVETMECYFPSEAESSECCEDSDDSENIGEGVCPDEADFKDEGCRDGDYPADITESENNDFLDEAVIGEFRPKPVITSQVIMTNPEDGSLLSGRVISFSEDEFKCKINSDLKNGQLIKFVSIYYDDKVSYLSADIIENNKEKGTLSLSVCEYYEEI